MDHGLRCGMCSLPTKQEYYPSHVHPTVPHPHLGRCAPVPTDSAGPHHGTTTQRTSRLSADDSRPRVLSSSRLPPLRYDNHGPGGHSAVLRQRISMVWTAIEDHF